MEILLPRAGIIAVSYHAPLFSRQVYQGSVKRSYQNMTAFRTVHKKDREFVGDVFLERNLGKHNGALSDSFPCLLKTVESSRVPRDTW